MVNTAKRRLSKRIQARDLTSSAPPSHDTTSSMPTASTFSPSYSDKPTFDTQDQASSPTMTEPHSKISTQTTRHNTRSQDTVPELLSAADQTSPSSRPVIPPTSESASNGDTPLTIDKKDNVVSWILENYERMPDSNVPRSGIFEHYKYYCSSRHVKPVNTASFGKMIRMAFPDVITRRLGNRGQSKYQYCNIQRIDPTRTDKSVFMEIPAANSIEPYDHQQEQEQHERRPVEGLDYNATGMLINWDTNTDPYTSRSTATPYPTSSSSGNDNLHSIYDTQGFPSYRLPPPIGFTPSSTSSSSPLSLAPHLGDLVSNFSGPNKSYQQNYSPPSPSRLASSFSSSASASMFTPSLSALDTTNLTGEFANHYNQHCRDLYNTICAGQFDQIQGIYDRFYYEMPSHHRLLLNTQKMMEAVWRWDCVLYDSLIVNLLPEVDTPTTDRMISGLLGFTRTLPKYLSYLLRDYSATLRQKKYDVASIFVAKLRRHLTLNQFAIGASDVVRQPSHMEIMKADWKKLDASAILDHVFWICDCRSDDIYQILEQDIPRLLDAGNTLEKWIKWEENLINKYLPSGPKTRENEHIDEYLKTAKQFMLKWKVYTGLVMQEFYGMNASSIDLLKSLQCFLDDLVLYHVEERIANMNAEINQRISPERASRVNAPFPATNVALDIDQDN